jgi:peptidoglycan/xylan/chitin deacetylase (PgdA/CDA1 family)
MMNFGLIKRAFGYMRSKSLINLAAYTLLLVAAGYSLFGIYKIAGEALAKDRPARQMPALTIREQDKNPQNIHPFSEPVITITFDDGWETIYSDALGLLQKHGIPTTQYVLSGTFNDQHYMSKEQVLSLQEHGHEIASHGIDHLDLANTSQRVLASEAVDSKRELETITGRPIRHFASPYGSFSERSVGVIMQSYVTHRNTLASLPGVDEHDVNLPATFSKANIVAYTVRKHTDTKAHNAWLVITYHQIDDQNPSEYAVSAGDLEDQLALFGAAPARIMTIGSFIDAYDKQKASK